MVANESVTDHRTPWNKGKIVGQKAPFRLKDIWALRVRLQLDHRTRELALFDLGIDSKLRGCDLLKLKVRFQYFNGLARNWRPRQYPLPYRGCPSSPVRCAP